MSWGLLNKEGGKYYTWSGQEVQNENVAMRPGNIMTRTELLPWDKCTKEQETKLKDICKWLVDQGIEPSQFCGHDECAVPSGRKCDPGGSLSFTMSELRAFLNDHKQLAKDEILA